MSLLLLWTPTPCDLCVASPPCVASAAWALFGTGLAPAPVAWERGCWCHDQSLWNPPGRLMGGTTGAAGGRGQFYRPRRPRLTVAPHWDLSPRAHGEWSERSPRSL